MPHEAGRIVAILRGIEPENVVGVADVLREAGIGAIEIPLNSPRPFDSIARLSTAFGEECLCGAGTVLAAADVRRVYAAGGRLIVSPNTDAEVIGEAVLLKMQAMPGFATASEAFAAIAAGARDLKLFPATTYGPAHLKALKAVLPADMRVYAVGGVGAEAVGEWIAAGAHGFGFGAELFKPSYTRSEIGERARHLVGSVRAAIGH